MDEESWQIADWTDNFEDIEGELKPKPYLRTRLNMLWNDEYFFFGCEMEEPHVWAKLKKRDSVIFFDNDFEIFIDPDGDTHNYYEFELNDKEKAKEILRKIYYKQRTYFMKNGKFAESFDELNFTIPTLKGEVIPIEIYMTPTKFEIIFSLEDEDFILHISEDGLIWE